MNPNDGLVISNYITQALEGKAITIHGSREETRSLQHGHDLVTGVVRLMDSDCKDHVNIGNPEEYTVLKIADLVRQAVGIKARLEYHPAIVDDPLKRKPE